MTRAEMLSRISSEELSEQMAYDMVTAEDEEARRNGPVPGAGTPDPREMTRKLHAYFSRRAVRRGPPAST